MDVWWPRAYCRGQAERVSGNVGEEREDQRVFSPFKGGLARPLLCVKRYHTGLGDSCWPFIKLFGEVVSEAGWFYLGICAPKQRKGERGVSNVYYTLVMKHTACREFERLAKGQKHITVRPENRGKTVTELKWGEIHLFMLSNHSSLRVIKILHIYIHIYIILVEFLYPKMLFWVFSSGLPHCKCKSLI